ncbi:hypothetical protein [Saccharospirillum impatiens]|uniref:hypothetical protein n=1 Tax=Saccharospirillum impatiens TaxID=169438 RepID=UPI0003FE6FC3|nr:hypothetical protein [Saccharospirillum impatiens]
MIEVFYTHRIEGPELVEHRQVVRGYSEAREIIEQYPWSSEVALTEELGEGGGLFFLRTGDNDARASLQLVPTEPGKGFLDLSIMANKGFLGIFGRRSASVTVDEVSIAEAKTYVKQLFDYSIDDLYQKHSS